MSLSDVLNRIVSGRKKEEEEKDYLASAQKKLMGLSGVPSGTVQEAIPTVVNAAVPDMSVPKIRPMASSMPKPVKDFDYLGEAYGSLMKAPDMAAAQIMDMAGFVTGSEAFPEISKRILSGAEKDYPSTAPQMTSVEAWENASLGDVVKFGVSQIGQVPASLAAMAVPGMAINKIAGPLAVMGSKVPGIAKLISKAGGIEKAARIISGTGATTLLEGGAISSDAYRETGEMPGRLEILPFALAAGMLERLPVERVLSRLSKVAPDIAKRVAARKGSQAIKYLVEVAKDMGIEGGTEFLQTLVEKSAVEAVKTGSNIQGVLNVAGDPEAFAEAKGSFVAGSFGSAGPSMASNLTQLRTNKDDNIDTEEKSPTPTPEAAVEKADVGDNVSAEEAELRPFRESVLEIFQELGGDPKDISQMIPGKTKLEDMSKDELVALRDTLFELVVAGDTIGQDGPVDERSISEIAMQREIQGGRNKLAAMENRMQGFLENNQEDLTGMDTGIAEIAQKRELQGARNKLAAMGIRMKQGLQDRMDEQSDFGAKEVSQQRELKGARNKLASYNVRLKDFINRNRASLGIAENAQKRELEKGRDDLTSLTDRLEKAAPDVPVDSEIYNRAASTYEYAMAPKDEASGLQAMDEFSKFPDAVRAKIKDDYKEVTNKILDKITPAKELKKQIPQDFEVGKLAEKPVRQKPSSLDEMLNSIVRARQEPIQRPTSPARSDMKMQTRTIDRGERGGKDDYMFVRGPEKLEMAETKMPAPETPKMEMKGNIPEKVKELQEAPEKSKAATPKLGFKNDAYTPSGKKLKVRYAVLSVNDLITSDNSRFDPDLQPRDRTLLESQEQIRSISEKPIVEKLITKYSGADTGTPIVVEIDGEYHVLSGNARTMGIRRGYESGKMKPYQDRLNKKASDFGVKSTVKEKPVLVRILNEKNMSKKDLAALARELNAEDKLAQTAKETAKNDADAVVKHAAKLKSTDLLSGANTDFIRSFFADVTHKNDRGRFVTENGEISKDGKARLERAVFSAAYGEGDILSTFAEDDNPNIKRILKSMIDSGPRMAAIKKSADAGNLHDLAINDAVAEAAKKLSELRASGETIEGYMAQGQLFSDGMSELSKDLLRVFDKYKNSGKKINEVLEAYNDKVEKLGDPKQKELTGTEKTIPSRNEILDEVVQEMEQKYEKKTPSLFKSSRKGAAYNPGALLSDLAAMTKKGLYGYVESAYNFIRRGSGSFIRWMSSNVPARIRKEAVRIWELARALHKAAKDINKKLGRRGGVISLSELKKTLKKRLDEIQKEEGKPKLSGKSKKTVGAGMNEAKKVGEQEQKEKSEKVIKKKTEKFKATEAELKQKINDLKEKIKAQKNISKEQKEFLLNLAKEKLTVKQQAQIARQIIRADTPIKAANVINKIDEMAFKQSEKVSMKRMLDAIKSAKKLSPAFQKVADDLSEKIDNPKNVYSALKKIMEYSEESELPFLDEDLKAQAESLLSLQPENITDKIADTITNVFKGIVHQSNVFNTAMMKGRAKSIKDVSDDVKKKIATSPDVKIGDDGKRGMLEWFFNGLMMDFDAITDMLGNSGHEMFYDDVRKGESIAKEIVFEGKETLENIFAKYGMGPNKFMGIKTVNRAAIKWLDAKSKVIADNGKAVSLTRGEKMNLVANLLDKSTYDVVTGIPSRPKKVGSGNTKGVPGVGIKIGKKKYSLSQSEADSIINGLSKQEREIVDGLRKFLNTRIKNESNKVWAKLVGYAKSLKDDYWPRKREVKHTGLNEGFKKWAVSALENLGMWKERVRSTKPVVIEDIATTYQNHINKAGNFIGFAVPLRNAEMALGVGGLSEALEEKFGKQYVERIKDQLNAVSVTNSAVGSEIEGVVARHIRRVSGGKISGNPRVALRQFGGLFTAAAELDFGDIAASFASDAFSEKVDKEMIENSSIIKDRYESAAERIVAPLFESGETWLGRGSGLLDEANRYLGIPFQGADRAVSRVLWSAVKKEVQRKNPELKGKELLEKVARRTEQVISRTQNVTSVLDYSGVAIASKKNPLFKPFTVFQSQGNSIYNVLRRTIKDYRDGKIDEADVLKNIFFANVANTVFSLAVGALTFRGIGDREKDEEGIMGFFKNRARLAWNYIRMYNVFEKNLGMVYGGSAVKMLSRTVKNNLQKYLNTNYKHIPLVKKLTDEKDKMKTKRGFLRLENIVQSDWNDFQNSIVDFTAWLNSQDPVKSKKVFAKAVQNLIRGGVGLTGGPSVIPQEGINVYNALYKK